MSRCCGCAGRLLTTVQTRRPGFGRFGVSVSGAMDPLALVVANRLVGNPDGAAALECTARPEALAASPTGASRWRAPTLSPTLDGEPVERARPLRGGGIGAGVRAAPARRALLRRGGGGLAVAPVFGSARPTSAPGSAASPAGRCGPATSCRSARAGRA